MSKIEVLLFDLIPTIDFLGLENEKTFTRTGEILLNLANKSKCNYLSSLLVSQNIQPLYEFDKEKAKKCKPIYVAKNMPLALRSKDEFSEKDKSEIIHNMSIVIGLIPYYVDYIDYEKYSQTPINFYEAGSRKIIHTEHRKDKPIIISPKEYFQQNPQFI